MIHELAAYEKATHEVFATESSLLQSLAFDVADYSPSRPARTLLIFNEDGKPAGMALYFQNYSTWRSRAGIYLEDLYVRPEERGKGYGKRLLQELAKLVTAADTPGGVSGRLEWSVLNWNKPSIDFYKSIGAKPQDEWTQFRVEGDALTHLAGR